MKSFRIGMGLMVALLLMVAASAAQAAVTLPLLFSDGAVLQRDQPIRVWGTAQAGARVEVAFNGSSTQVQADEHGQWSATLPAQGAGGPYVLTVGSGGDTRAVHDVLVGDVWLASGQSNMEMQVLQTANAGEVIASAGDTQIRHFKIPKSWSAKPENNLVGGSWVAASPQTVPDFSAAAYAFARELRQATSVPIGIIDSTWGGSSIQAWSGAQTLGIDANGVAQRMQQVKSADEVTLAATHRKLARWQGQPNDDKQWQAATHDDSDWATITVPGLWEANGWPGVDGVAWYRTRFELSAEEARAGVTVSLGRVDDGDQSWVNGYPVGGLTMQWNTPRIYAVPASALHAGSNSIAMRVTDTGGGGGIHGSKDELYVQLADGSRRALAGEWKFRTADVSVALVDDKNQIDTLLYNQMIHPLQPYPLRGVIWYQGESNAGEGIAYPYRDQFMAMIKDWRAGFEQPQLPFLWVQLANFISGSDTVDSSPWAMLRESQSAALALPATAQAVIIDVGDAGDIHPTDKQTVGHRLALAARHVAYGESLVYSGPVYRSTRFADGKAYVEFDLQGSTLAARGSSDAVQGFELAGADHRFHPAQAVIRGDAVLVSSDVVKQPQAVRYAWRDNPEQADLTNRERLPASPFRSDAW